MKKLADTLLIVGAGMLGLIPLLHFMSLSGAKHPRGQLFWFFAGSMVIFIGMLSRPENRAKVRWLAMKIADCYKVVAIFSLNAVLAFVFLELASGAIFKARELFLSSAPQRVPDPREKSSFYSSQPWASRYWHEFALSRKQKYHPFVIWRRAPFEGSTINIDRDGVRVTPGANCVANSFKVFTFGGSTMWGTGSPDWGTIPAYLQGGLETLRDGPICVRNFGESAYVSTQSIIELFLQLQSGNVPNVVVFYEGPNDVYTGYQSGQAGGHENLDQLAAKLENREISQSKSFARLLEPLKATALFALSDALVGKLSQPQAAPALVTYESMGIDAAKLSQAIVQRYLGNYKVVDGLSHEYGFTYFFFWPPYISIGEKPLTSEEKQLKTAVDPALDKLYREVYRDVEPLPAEYENFYYLGKMFDKYEPLVWLDDAHVTPEGNRMIAQKMLNVMAARTPLHRSEKQATH